MGSMKREAIEGLVVGAFVGLALIVMWSMANQILDRLSELEVKVEEMRNA